VHTASKWIADARERGFLADNGLTEQGREALNGRSYARWRCPRSYTGPTTEQVQPGCPGGIASSPMVISRSQLEILDPAPAHTSAASASRDVGASPPRGPGVHLLSQLSDEHIAALIATAAAGGLSVWAARRHPGHWVVPASRGVAILILVAYLAEQVANALRGTWTPGFNLPLQLTDAVTLVSILALWSPRPLLVELVYFWALTASLGAVITPDLGQPFPSIFYFTYFTIHSGAVVAACLLVFGRRLFPRPWAVWRVFALTAVFAALAGAGNLLTGGNYMFLREKPSSASLLDLMGPWPWYIPSTAALALAMFLTLEALARTVRGPDSGCRQFR
jgi:hypothetical integral membrane protein (TIGR02206 family)